MVSPKNKSIYSPIMEMIPDGAVRVISSNVLTHLNTLLQLIKLFPLLRRISYAPEKQDRATYPISYCEQKRMVCSEDGNAWRK